MNLGLVALLRQLEGAVLSTDCHREGKKKNAYGTSLAVTEKSI
jgi:hypothetical protein